MILTILSLSYCYYSHLYKLRFLLRKSHVNLDEKYLHLFKNINYLSKAKKRKYSDVSSFGKGACMYTYIQVHVAIQQLQNSYLKLSRYDKYFMFVSREHPIKNCQFSRMEPLWFCLCDSNRNFSRHYPEGFYKYLAPSSHTETSDERPL